MDRVVETFNLQRFLDAQAMDYDIALAEIRNGRKDSHWIWYIFPQKKGLGRSYNSMYYGLDGIEEAKAYLNHPILGARLREISQALLSLNDNMLIRNIMGSHIDVIKLKSCMKLFDEIAPDDVFHQVLHKYFEK